MHYYKEIKQDLLDFSVYIFLENMLLLKLISSNFSLGLLGKKVFGIFFLPIVIAVFYPLVKKKKKLFFYVTNYIQGD